MDTTDPWLLWRAPPQLGLPVITVLPEGTYLTVLITPTIRGPRRESLLAAARAPRRSPSRFLSVDSPNAARRTVNNFGPQAAMSHIISRAVDELGDQTGTSEGHATEAVSPPPESGIIGGCGRQQSTISPRRAPMPSTNPVKGPAELTTQLGSGCSDKLDRDVPTGVACQRTVPEVPTAARSHGRRIYSRAPRGMGKSA